MAFVRQLCGSWGGGHSGPPPSLDQCHSCCTSMSRKGDVRGLPTKYFQHGQALLRRNFRLLLTFVAPCRSDGVFIFVCGTARCPSNPADFHRDCCNHWQPDSLLECAHVGFRTVAARTAVPLGSQVWAINFQCCCLTINEVVAPGPAWLYLSDVSRLPAGHSPSVRAPH